MPFLALVFIEPLGLIGLVAPLILLALGLRRQDSREVFLGTTRFFTEEASGAGQARRRSLPAWLLVAALALVLGVLSLAKPGVEGPPQMGVVVALEVDRSPSMYLPHAGPAGAVNASGLRRIDAAFEAFCRWAGEYESTITGGVFVSTGRGEPVPWQELTIPDAPETAAPEMFWAAHDGPSTVWITDRAPSADARRHAGVFASGGAASPGLISLGPKGCIYWKADGTFEFREQQKRSGLVRVGPDVPLEIAELVQLWAEARGVQVAASSDSGDGAARELVQLSIDGGPAPKSGLEERRVRSGRDGWEADLAVHLEGATHIRAGWTPWLMSPLGEPLAEMAPGRLELGFKGLLGPPTDEAAFAVSWIGLFDRARLTPGEVVEASERSAAGSAFRVPPSEPAIMESPGASAKRAQLEERAALLRALLAGASALLGLAAFVMLARRPS